MTAEDVSGADNTREKPEQWASCHAAAFQDHSVVGQYRFRPAYPAQVFDALVDLVTDPSRVVLEVGTGMGELARRPVERVDRVDAVDLLSAMPARQDARGGDHAGLRRLDGAIEDEALAPP